VLLAERHTNATRAHIGRHLGISGTGVAYLSRIGEARVQADEAFATFVQTVELGSGLKSKVLNSDW